MILAKIENNIVENLIVATPENAAAFPDYIDIGEYPVQIGDTYENGIFKRNGEVLKTELERNCELMGDLNSAFIILKGGN